MYNNWSIIIAHVHFQHLNVYIKKIITKKEQLLLQTDRLNMVEAQVNGILHFGSINYDKLMKSLPIKQDFKDFLNESFGWQKDRLDQITKKIEVEKRFKGHLSDLFSKVKNDTILYIGSRGGETYLFGSLKNKGKSLEFNGLYQNGSYGFKGYIYLIDKQNNVKTITHYIAIDELAKKFIIKSIDDEELNASIHEFTV